MIVVPRYKELGIKKIWPLVKEIEELNEYFLILKENQFPERSFMWTIISILRPDVTKKLIEEARKHRSIKPDENRDNLVEVDPEIFKEIQSVVSQKGMHLCFPSTPITLVHTGKVSFLHKALAKWQRTRTKPKEYDENYNLLNSSGSRTQIKTQTIQRERQTNYSTPTIEMEDEKEEEKESSATSRTQRNIHSRWE